MRKIFVIGLLLLAGISSTLSQQYIVALNIDSLKKILLTAKDTERVNTLNLLSIRYLYHKGIKSDPVSGKYCADEAMALARKIGYDKGIGNALLNQGILLANKDFTSSLSSLHAALSLLKQADDKYALAFCFEIIAETFHTQGNNKVSILYRDSALNLFKKLGDTSAAIWNMAYIGHSYFDLGNYVKLTK